MTSPTDLAFNDTIMRVQAIGPDGIKANNPPLTKREYFAAMAMQGILSSSNYDLMRDQNKAEYAVIMADYLIKELNDKA